MNIGFTGTRLGMTTAQKAAVSAAVSAITFNTEGTVHFHHGNCVGADAQAALIAKEHGCRIVAHPPTDTSLEQRDTTLNDEVRGRKDYITRNHDIVDECDLLLAAPKERSESIRSGTWATIRYARRSKLLTKVFQP